VPNLDASVERVLIALVRGLRALEVRFCVLGAPVPELLLDERPPQATFDADAVIFVPDLATFERVKNNSWDFDRTRSTRSDRITKAAGAPTFFLTAKR